MAETWKQWQGQTVSERFHLGEYLGGSEHSAVYLADSTDRDPPAAAIKLVPENSPNAARQLSSWQLAATVSHPNLTRIFETGHCQIGGAKLLYAAMEYTEENLSQVVSDRPLTERETSDMLKPALEALAYLHARGLVHGRIKPANIMASGDQIKLSTDQLRRTGEPIGDPGEYDPPETTSSAAADAWSLGMTLVEVLSQRLPAWDRNAPGDPVVPETLPAPLRDIACHCLRRDPNLRWTTAEIANRLNPPTPVQRAQPVRRGGSLMRSRYLIPTAVLFLGLIGFVSWKLFNYFPKSSAESSPATEEVSAKRLTEPRRVGGAAPSSEKKQATHREMQNSSDTPQTSAATPSVEPLTVPSARAAGSGVIHQVLPDVPPQARDTIQGTVRVAIRVSVDSSGNVTDATIDSPGPSRYFANLALRAARQWKFAPAHGAASVRTLRFEFSRKGTEAFAH